MKDVRLACFSIQLATFVAASPDSQSISGMVDVHEPVERPLEGKTGILACR